MNRSKEIHWFGEIPSNWEVTKVKHIFNVKNGGTPKSNVEEFWKNELIWITPEDLSNQDKEIHNSKRMISRLGMINSSATLIKKDSIVISTRAPIGNVKISRQEFTTNQGCKSLETKSELVNSGFYYYLISISKNYLNSLGQGTTFLELSNNNLKNIEVPIPAKGIQDSIVDFLDDKTSEIDSLIADKEKLIELMEEKRQAIIAERVTKGLNPNVEMKDSGIDWIGEIPEHWEMNKLKYLVYLRNEKVVNNTTLPYVGLENIESKTGKYYQSIDIEEQLVEGTSSAFYSGDVLFGKLRPYLAKCIVANFDGQCTTELLVMKTKENIILNEYLNFLLLSDIYIQVINSSTYGAKMPRANWDFISNLPIPLPNIKEQIAIIENVKNEITTIDELNEELRLQIEKLKEYRQSLIYEAVTGKIDVREYKKVLS